MSDMNETVPVAYDTPREWLEGKRRFVKVLRQLAAVVARAGVRAAADRPGPTVRC